MPHFSGQSAGPLGSQDWQVGLSERWRDQTAQAVGKAVKDYEADKAEAARGRSEDAS
jgi:limonene 1,2-monooxygenase